MGFGSAFKGAIKDIGNVVTLGASTGNFGDVESIGGSLFGANTLSGAFGRGGGGGGASLAGATPEQLTAANVFSRLSPEQQKDILINNPNIVTALGEQRFDPLTNTLTLTESPFVKGQRERQEALASALTGSLSGQLPGTDVETVRQATFEQGKALLDPEFTSQKRQLEQQLADQGLPPGSEAYNEAVNRLEESQGRQLRQLSLASVAQGIQTGEAQRAARFNEISSLLGQQQVGGIGFGQFQPQVSGLDLFGAEQAGLNRAFQAEQARKQRSAQQRQALVGALGQAGSAGISAFALSDRDLKENVVVIGKSPSGIEVVEFDYKDKAHGEGRYRGAIAQQVEEINPEAVSIDPETGFRKVDYSKIDVLMQELKVEDK